MIGDVAVFRKGHIYINLPGLQTFENGDKRSKEEEKEGEAPKQDEDEPKGKRVTFVMN